MKKETEIQNGHEEDINYFLNKIEILENNLAKAQRELTDLGERILEETGNENLIVNTSDSQLAFLNEENDSWIWPKEVLKDFFRKNTEE